MQAVIAAAVDRFGDLDVLMSNAGLGLGKDPEETTLACDDATFITGAILPVDGGITADGGRSPLF